MESIDPFEHSRKNTLSKMFDKDLDNKFAKKGELVTRWWPRDPNGKELEKEKAPDGYTTPNTTHLWGSTLLDFFYFNKIPQSFVGISTGSILSAWMKANGELEYATTELEWAEVEEKPKLRPAADIMEIINAKDLMIMMGSCGTPMRDDIDGPEGAGDEPANVAPAVAAPFEYKKYPRPWPLVPFSSTPPTLQSQIPLHLLPETLIVHDPFELLQADWARREQVDWTSTKDIIYKYRLNLTVDSVKERIAAERAKIAEAATSSEPVVVGMLFDCSESQIANSSAASGNAYRMTVPPPPASPSHIAEAHLFISPSGKIGEGNHSYVYRVEWDLPRSVFSEPKICTNCVEKAAREILRTKAGKMAVSGANGASESEEFLRREGQLPGLYLGLAATDQIGGDRVEPTDENKEHAAVSHIEDTKSISTVHVETVPWYDPGSTAPCPCPHLMKGSVSGPLPGPTPPTAQVSVVAKLSIPGDQHLEREAVNYQQFGPEFSQHWTGYTLAHPIRNPTPAGAIVPNFYGYYSKEPEGTATSDNTYHRGPYLSPILLLEDCGKPIEPSELGRRGKEECAALLLRLHHHGWTQGSFFPRNILMQFGDHGDFPLMKSSKDRRFRLIDFGRGKSLKNAVEADRLRGDGKNTEKNRWERDRNQEKNDIWGTLEFSPY